MPEKQKTRTKVTRNTKQITELILFENNLIELVRLSLEKEKTFS